MRIVKALLGALKIYGIKHTMLFHIVQAGLDYQCQVIEVRFVCAGKTRRKPHLVNLIHYFTPDTYLTVFGCMDCDANQLAHSDLIVGKDETAARAQVYDTATELRSRSFPGNFQISLDPGFFSAFIHRELLRVRSPYQPADAKSHRSGERSQISNR